MTAEAAASPGSPPEPSPTPPEAEAAKPLGAASHAAFAVAAALAGLVAFLPFLRGLAAGRALYFRDLSLLFHPFRRYAVEGLRAGEFRFWDPYVHEGVPLLYLPVSYPFDLLQALWVDERWFSLLLACHVPLAAVGFVALARRLGVRPLAAAGGALVYALGGFLLSTVNLYLYVQAAAWAPIVTASLLRAADGRGRDVATAALATAVLFSTTGAEVALQGVAFAVVMVAAPGRPAAMARTLAAVMLGMALAAPQFLVLRAQMAAGARAQGLPVDAVLNQSIHPFGLLQMVVANLFGDLGQLPNRWWGSNFFERGFPYILSLYLGATVVALAAVGATGERPRRGRLLAFGAIAVVVTLGRWAGLGAVLEMLPPSWRLFRFPVKAFFTVHVVVAVLAAYGLDLLVRDRHAWRRLSIWLGALGAALLAVPLLRHVLPGPAAWFVDRFFPPALSPDTRLAYLKEMTTDAARGGALALVALAIAFAVRRGTLTPRLGASLACAVAVGDLLRAGGGLNPMLEASFFRASPEVQTTIRALTGLQRVFTCPIENSEAYWQARRALPGRHEVMTFAVQNDTLTPHINRRSYLRSALSPDLTSLVPLDRLLPAGIGCHDTGALVPYLQAAGVSHVLSLDRLAEGAGLHRIAELAPRRTAPLRIQVYAVTEPRPLRYVAARVRSGPTPDGNAAARTDRVAGAPHDVDGAAGIVRVIGESAQRLDLDVEATRPTALMVLDGSFPGWTASVDGRRAEVLTSGHHRAVWVPAGRSRVVMAYRPPGLAAGLVVSATALLVLLTLWVRSPRKAFGAVGAGGP